MRNKESRAVQRGAKRIGGRTPLLVGGGLVAGASLIYRLRRGDGARISTVNDQADSEMRAMITVDQSPETVYRFWRDLEGLSRTLQHVRDVESVDGRRSRWAVRGPLGRTVRWAAAIDGEQEPALISWRTEGRTQAPHRGTIRFSPASGGRGTRVEVTVSYRAPAGPLGAAIGRVVAIDFKGKMERDLRRIRAVLEAGEAPTTEGQPAGERSAAVGNLFDRLAQRKAVRA